MNYLLSRRLPLSNLSSRIERNGGTQVEQLLGRTALCFIRTSARVEVGIGVDMGLAGLEHFPYGHEHGMLNHDNGLDRSSTRCQVGW